MFGSRTSGFTLIELMIALSIAAVLAVLALPSYSLWIADNQIRNAAESIASGLRYAQGEAIKQNATVEFILDPTTGTGGWTAQVIDRTTCAVLSPLQVGTFREGADKAAFTALPAGATTVQFTALGGVEVTVPCSPPLNRVQITSSTGAAGTRDLEVLVGNALPGNNRTGIKICDPKWPANDPKGCPP